MRHFSFCYCHQRIISSIRFAFSFPPSVRHAFRLGCDSWDFAYGFHHAVVFACVRLGGHVFPDPPILAGGGGGRDAVGRHFVSVFGALVDGARRHHHRHRHQRRRLSRILAQLLSWVNIGMVLVCKSLRAVFFSYFMPL